MCCTKYIEWNKRFFYKLKNNGTQHAQSASPDIKFCPSRPATLDHYFISNPSKKTFDLAGPFMLTFRNAPSPFREFPLAPFFMPDSLAS